MREIVLDTETTGLDPFKGHRLVEIGCIELINRVRTGNYFHYYLNPQRDMPEEAFNIHGISSEFLKDKPLFSSIATKFIEFIEGASLIIHNAAFDLKFINYELKKIGLSPISNEKIIDTLLIARKKFPGSPASLDALCKKFNIDLSSRDKHGALLDSELLSDVYIELTGGNQSKMVFIEKEEIIETEFLITKTINYPPRKFLPSNDELELHKEFLKKIKNPLWLLNES
jgi:DNA polymerase-3 subunit epsilon